MEGRWRSCLGVLIVGLTVACATQPSATHQQATATPAGATDQLPSAAPVGATALPAGPRTTEPAARTFHTATGTLASFERHERLLTIEAATGSSSYRVAADARAWLGKRRLPVSDLSAYVGAQVTIAFGEANGVRTTHTVRLAEGERAGRPRQEEAR